MKPRTSTQNSALHKYFELLADELNLAGYDMKKTLKPTVDIPWDRDTVKDYLWRPIQEAMLQKGSTTELTTAEVDKVYKVLDRHLAEKLGVSIRFPSTDPEMY